MSSGPTAPSPDSPRSGVRDAVRNRALLRLLAAFAAVSFSELAFVTGLSIYAFRVGGTLAVGFVGFRLLPGALSSALLAPLVDTRANALTRIAGLRVVLLGVAGAGVLAGIPFAVVLGFVALDAVTAAPYRPAQARVVPTLARAPAEVSATAAGISIVKTLGQAVGALAGGVAATLIAPGSVMAGAAAVMAGAAVTTVGLGRPHARTSGRWLRGIRAGVASIPRVLTHREASPFVVASGLRTLLRGLWGTLLVVVALRLFGLGRSGVGLLNAASGAGAAIALPITASLIGRSRLAGPCALAFIGAGLTLSVVGVLGVAALAVILVCGWGLAMALADATSLSLLSRLLDAPTLSRTVGVMESLKLALEGLGALLAPALVALFGIRSSLILAGLPLPLAILLSYQRMRRADVAAAGRGAVVSLLHRVNVLHSLDMASLEDVAARARRVSESTGSVIVRQGDPGDAFYVIESGEAEVLLDGFHVGRLGPGSGFGERALLRATPRTATVRALTEMTLYAIDRASFLSAVTGLPPEALDDPGVRVRQTGPDPRTRSLTQVLADVTFLGELSSEELARVADAATVEDWEAGAVIVREGETATAFFVLLSGRVRTTIRGRQVSELLPGDWFGEIAVLHGVPRTATVAAAETTRTCRVPAEALSGLMRRGDEAIESPKPGYHDRRR